MRAREPNVERDHAGLGGEAPKRQEEQRGSCRVVECIGRGAEYVEIGGQRKHVIGYLGDFLFPPERARARVSSLSGGERNRLLLARLFSRPANVLVLDEPTNDLDMETLELLETLLQDYAGTLFVASHDRAFLDNVVTQVIVFEGQGVLREYPGGYSDWDNMRSLQHGEAAAAPKARARSGEFRHKADSQRKLKLSFKEARELEMLPLRIGALEREQASITRELADPELYREKRDRVKALQQRFVEVEEELMQCLARWEALETRQQTTTRT